MHLFPNPNILSHFSCVQHSPKLNAEKVLNLRQLSCRSTFFTPFLPKHPLARVVRSSTRGCRSRTAKLESCLLRDMLAVCISGPSTLRSGNQRSVPPFGFAAVAEHSWNRNGTVQAATQGVCRGSSRLRRPVRIELLQAPQARNVGNHVGDRRDSGRVHVHRTHVELGHEANPLLRTNHFSVIQSVRDCSTA